MTVRSQFEVSGKDMAEITVKAAQIAADLHGYPGWATAHDLIPWTIDVRPQTHRSEQDTPTRWKAAVEIRT